MADTTELTNVEVAGLGKCSYLVGKRKVIIKDEAQVASRVGGAERAVLYFGKLLFESDEKKFGFSNHCANLITIITPHYVKTPPFT